jgi:DNA-binding transcriptional regulator YiaG
MRQDFPSPFRQPGRRLPTFDVSSSTRIDSSGVESRSVRAVAAVAAARAIVAVMTTTTIDIRSRREHLGLSRLALAVRAGVSPAWVQALEAGLQPVGSRALARVEHSLDEIEREAPAPGDTYDGPQVQP